MNLSLISLCVWLIGMWPAYIIVVARHVRAGDTISQAKKDIFDEDSNDPYTIAFWPFALVIAGVRHVGRALLWVTDTSIKKLSS